MARSNTALETLTVYSSRKTNESQQDDKDEICKVQSEDFKKTNIQNRNTIQNICVLIIIDNLPTT